MLGLYQALFFYTCTHEFWGFPSSSAIKNLPAVREMRLQSLGWEDSLEEVKVTQSCPTLCDPMDCSLPGSSVHGILQARILEWAAFPFSRGSAQPRIETRSPTLQADSLPAEPPGKTKKPRVGSLSLLQRIFRIQESNRGLLHCKRILYQLSYEGSPRAWQPNPVFLPGESHGQRSLAGYSP